MSSRGLEEARSKSSTLDFMFCQLSVCLSILTEEKRKVKKVGTYGVAGAAGERGVQLSVYGGGAVVVGVTSLI